MTTLRKFIDEYSDAIENSYYSIAHDMMVDAIEYLEETYRDEDLYNNFSDEDIEDVIFNDSNTYTQIDRDGIEYAMDILKARDMYDEFIESEYMNYPEECIDSLDNDGIDYSLDGTTINGDKVRIAECLIKNIEFGGYGCGDEALYNIIYNFVREYIRRNANHFQNAGYY